MASGPKSLALWLIVGGALAALAYWKRQEVTVITQNIGAATTKIVSRVVSTLTRGFRNNNPLNIDKGQDWQGEASTSLDERFETFSAPEYGFRAAARIVDNYGKLYGLRTIEGIVSRWAPPIENPTPAYVKYVSDFMGFPANERLPLEDERVMVALLDAMTRFENSRLNPYSYDVMVAGVRMARGQQYDV